MHFPQLLEAENRTQGAYENRDIFASLDIARASNGFQRFRQGAILGESGITGWNCHNWLVVTGTFG